MERMPAMIVGVRLRIKFSGLNTPADIMPMPDLAIPYAAPKFAKTIAATTPRAPKKGCHQSERVRVCLKGAHRIDRALL